jgi:UDP-glucose 4-epimerase
VVSLLIQRPDVERVVAIDLAPLQRDHPKLEVRAIDLADPEPGGPQDLDEAMDGASAVIHLAWRSSDGRRVSRRDAPEAALSNQKALRTVLGAAAKWGVDALVLASSATVYGAWADNEIPLSEYARIRPNPEFSFAVSKAEAERAVAEWADDHPGVAVAVLRPTVTVGPDERPLYRALGITRSPGSGDSTRPVQYLHVDDLATAVVLAWEKRLQGAYNVAPDAGIPEEQARALAGGVARVSLPERLAAAVSALGWRLWRTGIPVEARAYATHPWVVAPDRLEAAGWSPEYSSEEALVATDDRVHWDDLPPGRRQNYNLLIGLIALAGAGAGAGVVIAAIRRRHRDARG